jgi:hypothetical protein
VDALRRPQLDSLVEAGRAANQNIRIAEARYRQATALLDAAQAQFPTLGSRRRDPQPGVTTTTGGTTASAGADPQHQPPVPHRQLGARPVGPHRPHQRSRRPAPPPWPPTWQAARLSAQAAVQAYLQLRINDAQHALLERTVAPTPARPDHPQPLRRRRGRPADVAQAEAQLKTAQAQLIDLDIQRRQLEHAIAVLTGRPPSDLAVAAASTLPTLPRYPACCRPRCWSAPRHRRRRTPRRRRQRPDRRGPGRLLPDPHPRRHGGTQSSALARVSRCPTASGPSAPTWP